MEASNVLCEVVIVVIIKLQLGERGVGVEMVRVDPGLE